MKKIAAIAAILAICAYAWVSAYVVTKGKTYRKQAFELKQQADSTKFLIDSLRHENFILQTTVDRYDIAIEFLKESDYTAWEKLDWILSHQVE